MRNSAENKGGIGSPASRASAASITTTAANRAPPTNKIECETDETVGEKGNKGTGQGDTDRTVTCMRCHESLPFLLVPSHGPKCKGKKVGSELPEGATAAASSVALRNEGPPSKDDAESGPPHLNSSVPPQIRTAAVVEAAGSSREGLLQPPPLWSTAGKNPASLPSSGDLGSIPKGYPARSGAPFYPPSDGPRAWHGHGTSRKGAVLTPDVRVPPSPPRPKSVRSWGTRQVTSWLREIMRPPRADIISRFHEGGVVGTTLLGLTDRYGAGDIPRMAGVQS